MARADEATRAAREPATLAWDAAAGSGSSLQLLERAIKLIFVLRGYDRKVSLQELATELEVSKSAVHRLLGTLSRLGLVVRDAGGRYQMGPKIKELSAELWTEADLREIALPFMKPLRDASGETVSLHVLDGVTHVVVEQCESVHEVQWVRRVGRVYTLLRGANALAILAFLPAADARAVIAKVRTSSDRGPTTRELQAVRNAGHARYERGGPVDGLAIAAPILARNGQPLGTLCISGPLPRFDAAAADRVAPELMRVALAISKAMGFREPREVTA